jgi:hypothetical protein
MSKREAASGGLSQDRSRRRSTLSNYSNKRLTASGKTDMVDSRIYIYAPQTQKNAKQMISRRAPNIPTLTCGVKRDMLAAGGRTLCAVYQYSSPVPAQSLRRAEVLDVLLPLLEQLIALTEEAG